MHTILCFDVTKHNVHNLLNQHKDVLLETVLYELSVFPNHIPTSVPLLFIANNDFDLYRAMAVLYKLNCPSVRVISYNGDVTRSVIIHGEPCKSAETMRRKSKKGLTCDRMYNKESFWELVDGMPCFSTPTQALWMVH